jgi:glycosyltransferase involved in cell wall biosynthesis
MNTSKSEKKLYILVTSDEPNNVILGHAAFAKQAGLSPVFVFPFRKQVHDLNAYIKYETLRLNFLFSTNGMYEYIVSIFKFIYHASKAVKDKNCKILAIDLTGVFAAATLKINGNKIYTLVNDNFSARYKMPRVIYLMLRWLEGGCYAITSELCIFPSIIRYEILGSPKLKEVEYLPNILNDDYAPQWYGSRGEGLKVLLCGWLVKSRGLDILNKIIEHADEKIEFVLMGSGDTQMISELCKNKNVQYIEHGSRNEALEMMSEIDINLALYNPDILINRYALPQKIYDSLMIGCPVLVNSEVQMSQELLSNELCLVENYKNAKGMAGILNDYVKNKEKLKDMSKRILKYNQENLSYTSVTMKGVEIYRKIAQQ